MGFSPRKEWQKSALTDLAEGQLSVPQIASKYGKQRDTIYRLARAANINRQARPPGFTAVAECAAISKEHRSVGVHLTLCSDGRSMDDLSAAIGTSKVNVTRLRSGQYDPTLSELLRISEICRCSVDDLLQLPKLKAVQ